MLRCKMTVVSLGSQSAPDLVLRADHPHPWARASPPHLRGLWDCAEESALRRPGLFLPEPPHQPGHQHGEEQRKLLVFGNPIKTSCKNHGRWPHGHNLCFWKSLPASLLILKHTRNFTEWKIPDSLTQPKTLNAAKKNYNFLGIFSVLESYVTLIYPYHVY